MIAVGAPPELAASANQAAVQRLCAHFDASRAMSIPSADHISEALADLPRTFDAPVPTLHWRIEGRDVLFVPATFPRATQINTRHWLTDIEYDFNLERYRRNMIVRAYGKTIAPQIWDSVAGKITLARTEVGDGYVDVFIPFDSGPAALLVWDKATFNTSSTEH